MSINGTLPVETATSTPTVTGSVSPTANFSTPSPTATPTPSPLDTATATASPTASATALPCAGDCSDDGRVTIDELVLGVDISLGNASIDRCPPLDRNGQGDVSMSELLEAINAALIGC